MTMITTRKKLIEVALRWKPLMQRRYGRSPSGTATPARCTFGGLGDRWRRRVRCYLPKWWMTHHRVPSCSQPRRPNHRNANDSSGLLRSWSNGKAPPTRSFSNRLARKFVRAATHLRGQQRSSQGNGVVQPDQLPAFHDPFAGGGSIPLEAQRLGLKAYASDLNRWPYSSTRP